MSKVQFIKTERGEELAVLPRQEYERLKALAASEDAGAARIVRRTKAAVATGQEVLVPRTVVDRLAAGENPVRVLREWRDLTQTDISSRSDISQGHLSDIESGRRTGTPTALRKIADVLKVPLDLLVR
jgi:ribosome-binding protein aMBF1 (putative translation factor)